LDRFIELLVLWSKQRNLLIAKVKMSPIEVANYNIKVFSRGRVVVGPPPQFVPYDRPLPITSDRFLPKRVIEIFYEDEDEG
jgi:hypothetical protein